MAERSAQNGTLMRGQITPRKSLKINRLDRVKGYASIDESVDEANGVVGGDIIIDRLGQKQELRAIGPGNVRHVRFYRDDASK